MSNFYRIGMEKRKKVRIAIAALIAGFLVLPSAITISTLQYNTSIQKVVMPVQSSAEAYNPSNGMIYVSALYKDRVYVYNSSNLQLESTISTNGMINFMQGTTGEIFDPFNGLLYFAGFGRNTSGITLINTTSNSFAGIINFGSNNFTSSMVIGKMGKLFVSEGMYITEINGTKIIANYSTNTQYNDAITYALNEASNTSYLIYNFQGVLMEANNLSHLNGTNVSYGPKFSYPSYMQYEQRSDKLLLATSNHLFVINPSNVSDIFFKINLEKSAGGVKATMYSNSTGYLYVATYGSQAIYVYNDTTGSYVGAMRQTDNYNTPTGIIQLSGDKMIVSVGNRLVLENERPSNLLPNFSDLETVFAVSAAVVGSASVIVYFLLRRST